MSLCKVYKSGSEHGETRGMAEARKLLGARLGPATEEDRPPPSVFPMTPAAREAVRLNREKDARK